MLDALKVIILGIVEGITEWLPVSSTGHLILVGDVLSTNLSHDFMEMVNVVIQLGAIMAVVVLYFHKLNPFSPKKTHKQKLLTWQMWIKVAIACVPAAVVGILLNDWLDSVFYKPLPVSIMLIVYGILFIVVENRNKNRKPEVTKISELDIRMLLWIGAFQMRCNNRRSIANRCVQRSGSRIYIFPCNSGYVRSKFTEACQIWICIYRS